MAGGESTRLRPMTCLKPKPLVPILDRPVMEYIVELLIQHGINDIFVTLCFLPDAIRDHFGDGSGMGARMRYLVEEQPLGTAGSVRNVRRYLDGTFLVISGDTLTNIDLTRLVAFHRDKKALATLALSRVEDPGEYGVVLTDREGQVVRFLEKPGASEVFSHLANTGIYVMEPEIFDFFEDGQVFDFSRDLFPLLLSRGNSLYAVESSEYWCDIGSITRYRQANQDLLNGIPGLTINGVRLREGVFTGKGARIDADVVLESPCFIGANARIVHGSRIGPGSVVGSGTIVDEGTSVKDSVLWEKVVLGKKCDVHGAVICSDTYFGGDNLVSEGAVIGEGTAISRQVKIRPGTRIWPGKGADPF